MKKVLLWSGLFWLAIGLAFAQPAKILTGGGCTTNCTFGGTTAATGPLAVGSGTPLIVTVTPTATSGNTGVFGVTQAFDHSQNGGTNDDRWTMFQTTLSPSQTTADTWENLNSFLYLNGPGIASHEINLMHSYFQVNAGANTVQAEDIESSMQNFGTVGNYDDFLAIQHNTTTGTAQYLVGIGGNLIQDNTTPGSILSYAMFACGPMQGSGAAPTLNFCLQNKDPNGAITTLGSVGIGTASVPVSGRQLEIHGPDSSGTTDPIWVNASNARVQFYVSDGDVSQFSGNVIIGTGGVLGGSLTINAATSGQAVKLVGATGTAGIQVVTVPDAATTLAGLAVPETFTAAQTFSGTVNVTGALSANGTAAVSCGAGTVSLTTLTVTNGIITHC